MKTIYCLDNLFDYNVPLKLTVFFSLLTHISWKVPMEAYLECSKILQRKITLTLLTNVFWKAYRTLPTHDSSYGVVRVAQDIPVANISRLFSIRKLFSLYLIPLKFHRKYDNLFPVSFKSPILLHMTLFSNFMIFNNLNNIFTGPRKQPTECNVSAWYRIVIV